MISCISNRSVTTTVGLLNICNCPSFPFTSFPPFSSSFLSSLSFYSIVSCLFLPNSCLLLSFLPASFFFIFCFLSLFSRFASLLPPLSFFPSFQSSSFILFPFFSFSKFLFDKLNITFHRKYANTIGFLLD